MTDTEMAKKKRSPKERERNREYQKEYYQKNRAKLLEQRKERYEGNSEYQRKMKVAAKRRYWLGTRPLTTEGVELPDTAVEQLQPKGVIPITVENQDDARYGETLQVQVFSTEAVGQLLDRTPATLRVWLTEGILPEPYHRGRTVAVKVSKGNNPRLFTMDEMQAIEDCRELLALPSHGKKHDIFTRAVQERFAAMAQGLVIQPRG